MKLAGLSSIPAVSTSPHSKGRLARSRSRPTCNRRSRSTASRFPRCHRREWAHFGMFREKPAALRQSDGVRENPWISSMWCRVRRSNCDECEAGIPARSGVVLKQQIEVLGDRTGQRIFNGDHRGKTSPLSTSRKTSAEKAQGRMVASGSMFNAASWLKEPSSPWIANRISCPETKF